MNVAQQIAAALRARGWTLATAESCTGGLVGARLTGEPGSSAWYVGGVVAYSNELKTRLLGVSPALLAAHGAVSDPTAAAMAEGARTATGADCAVAITGIAGPGGGTPEKPVGTVFVAVATPGGASVRRHAFDGGREAVRDAAVRHALALALDQLG
jgi:PncC family amidohydrolase